MGLPEAEVALESLYLSSSTKVVLISIPLHFWDLSAPESESKTRKVPLGYPLALLVQLMEGWLLWVGWNCGV